MGKFYSNAPKGEPLKRLRARKETIRFLLDYSKALRIKEYGKLQFEMLLN